MKLNQSIGAKYFLNVIQKALLLFHPLVFTESKIQEKKKKELLRLKKKKEK